METPSKIFAMRIFLESHSFLLNLTHVGSTFAFLDLRLDASAALYLTEKFKDGIPDQHPGVRTLTDSGFSTPPIDGKR